MKRHLLLYTLYTAVLLCAAGAAAQERCGMTVTSASMKRDDGLMTVRMNMKLSEFELAGNRVATFTPAIVGERDSLMLQSVGLYSRDRWFQYLRSGKGPVSGEEETAIRWSERPDELDYVRTVPYADWMDNSHLVLVRRDYACCRELLSEESAPVAGYRAVSYCPEFRYAQPVAEEVKTRELSGRAFIDFPVNRTEIHPEYRGNSGELAKIIATIDSVRNDADITVRRLTIKGYASPEGSYENNAYLAEGRTEALRQYVQTLYDFPKDFIVTDYEPEDWGGLREFVVSSNISNREELLAIIDDPELEPDTKDWRLKLRYPEEYEYLLRHVYPALRHSDYTIEYTIRSFTDTDEIGRLLHTAPRKLSLDEMMRYAMTLEPGSDEYNEVFDTAVRMYPDSEIANINAANSAMQRNDLVKAGQYLAKAGTSAEAEYARGVLAAMQGEYGRAVGLIRASGIEDSERIIAHIEEVAEYR